jgi:hypothetical protein
MKLHRLEAYRCAGGCRRINLSAPKLSMPDITPALQMLSEQTNTSRKYFDPAISRDRPNTERAIVQGLQLNHAYFIRIH